MMAMANLPHPQAGSVWSLKNHWYIIKKRGMLYLLPIPTVLRL